MLVVSPTCTCPSLWGGRGSGGAGGGGLWVGAWALSLDEPGSWTLILPLVSIVAFGQWFYRFEPLFPHLIAILLTSWTCWELNEVTFMVPSGHSINGNHYQSPSYSLLVLCKAFSRHRDMIGKCQNCFNKTSVCTAVPSVVPWSIKAVHMSELSILKFPEEFNGSWRPPNRFWITCGSSAHLFLLSQQSECGPAPITAGVLPILSFNCPAFSCHSFFRPLITCLAHL